VVTTASSPARGILYMVLSVLLFAGMDALVKWVSARHPVGQIIFFRNAFAFIPILLFLPAAGGLAALKTRRPGGHVLRALAGIGAMVCFFAAFSLMPLADAVAIGQAGPIFLTALSVPLLGEKVGFRRWSAVAAGFAGVLVMTRPGPGVFDPAALLAVGGAVLYALAMISIRRLSATERPLTIVFYFTLSGAIAGALSLPFQWVTPAPLDLVFLISIGLIGGFAQFAMTQAFRLAPVATIAPYEYGALVFAMLFGYLIWGDVPDAWLIIGAAIVVASGLYILHRETVLARAAGRAR
jgi:drug/metabolite transporter (DMT)-like permease